MTHPTSSTPARITEERLKWLSEISATRVTRRTKEIRAMARELLAARKVFACIPLEFGVSSSDVDDLLERILKERP